jgi:lambda family phage portal protein
MNLIDRIVDYVAPEWGLKRHAQRDAIEHYRRYEAAGRTKRTKNMPGSMADASTEVGTVTPLLRARGRYIVRNNSFAKRAVKSWRTSVVGRGIKLTLDGVEDNFTKRVEEMWKTWAGSTACDFYGRKNLYGIQRQVVNSCFVDGEVLVRKVRLGALGPNGEAPLQLQVLEADFLAEGVVLDSLSLRGGNYVQNGIEFNKAGQVQAYHIYDSHPGSSTLYQSPLRSRVLAADMLHIFMEERPGQNRGVSELAASLLKLRDFDDYADATLMRQKIASSFAVFIHGDNGSRPGSNDEGYLPERIEPGMIERLGPGESVSFGSPPETREYLPYTTRILQEVSAGLNISYEALTNDYSNVNFSSARMAAVEIQRGIQEWQDEIVITQLGGGVWGWFRQAMTIAGQIQAGASLRPSWTPPRREMLDVVKETKGIVDKLRARLTSWQDAVREMGYDPDVLEAQIVADIARFEAAGIKTSADIAHDKGADTGETEGSTPPAKVTAK